MAFLILIGATVFAPFIALSGLPGLVAGAFAEAGLGVYGTLFVILVLYAILGMVIERLSLLVITLPIVFPVVVSLGFDPIWFGVIMVIVLEMGLISPPVGVNCFVVSTIARDVRLETIFAGIMPFWAAMAVAIILLVALPQIAMLFPDAMFGRQNAQPRPTPEKGARFTPTRCGADAPAHPLVVIEILLYKKGNSWNFFLQKHEGALNFGIIYRNRSCLPRTPLYLKACNSPFQQRSR